MMAPFARIGAFTAIVGLFPIAFLMTLLWRFPMPMGGYQSGFTAAVKSPVAVVFYLLFGGIVVVGAAGAVAGWAAFKVAGGDPARARRLGIVYGFGVALLACLLLNSLEMIIGAW